MGHTRYYSVGVVVVESVTWSSWGNPLLHFVKVSKPYVEPCPVTENVCFPAAVTLSIPVLPGQQQHQWHNWNRLHRMSGVQLSFGGCGRSPCGSEFSGWLKQHRMLDLFRCSSRERSWPIAVTVVLVSTRLVVPIVHHVVLPPRGAHAVSFIKTPSPTGCWTECWRGCGPDCNPYNKMGGKKGKGILTYASERESDYND